jgi:hypothetical protein
VQRRTRRAREEIVALATARWRRDLEAGTALDVLSDQVSAGTLSPYAAAERLGRPS